MGRNETRDPGMKWAYGVTTVPSRRDDLLPRTLASLRTAGFENPILFVDGADSPDPYLHFGHRVVCRYPTIRTYGNWFLSLAELYIREPTADRYAIFQDDFVTYHNLRSYLTETPYPDRGYCNLYTFPSNQKHAPDRVGWYPSNQLGRGAVAIVLNNDATTRILGSKHMIDKFKCAMRGWKSVDGGLVTAFAYMGWSEFVHNPSLVQHTGTISSMGNNQHPLATSFRGETFDARELLQPKEGQK